MNPFKHPLDKTAYIFPQESTVWIYFHLLFARIIFINYLGAAAMVGVPEENRFTLQMPQRKKMRGDWKQPYLPALASRSHCGFTQNHQKTHFDLGDACAASRGSQEAHRILFLSNLKRRQFYNLHQEKPQRLRDHVRQRTDRGTEECIQLPKDFS